MRPRSTVFMSRVTLHGQRDDGLTCGERCWVGLHKGAAILRFLTWVMLPTHLIGLLTPFLFSPNPSFCDFEALGQVCTIDGFSVEQHDVPTDGRRSQTTLCAEEYKYVFTVGNGTRKYTSRIERHSWPGRCPEGSLGVLQKRLTYDAGQTVDCWRATSESSWVYQCGNQPHCFKVFNPAEEAKVPWRRGILMVSWGIRIVLIYVLCACGAVWSELSRAVHHGQSRLFVCLTYSMASLQAGRVLWR
mmetsp:Transcript_4274/g.9757  ORF Transcript_4274/g.9757 Transcript_4274/m.9757 type:complete len:245 (+) Transcript_4274:32-766(+)